MSDVSRYCPNCEAQAATIARLEAENARLLGIINNCAQRFREYEASHAATVVMKCWPIIRHMRWLYYRVQIERWYAAWGQLGMHDGNKQSDLKVLTKIWKGEA